MACISGCSGVIGFNVAMSPRPVCEIVRPARLDVCVSAKKFAQRAENTPILVFLGLLGEFFRAYRHHGQVIQVTWRLHAGNVGGFALHEALWLRVAGVSDPHVVQIPRLVGECEGCGAQSADHLGEKC